MGKGPARIRAADAQRRHAPVPRDGPEFESGAPLRLLGFTTPRPRLRSALPQTEDAPPLQFHLLKMSGGPALVCHVR